MYSHPAVPTGETAAGDLRLLVTQAKGKPSALLYRPVVPGITADVPSEAELTPQLWGKIEFK